VSLSSSARRRLAMMLFTLLLLPVVVDVMGRAAATGSGCCTGRDSSCSGHGDCTESRCLCDAGYEGECCDTWRQQVSTTDAATGGLSAGDLHSVVWHNCTHGVLRNGTLVQHCDAGDELLCQAAGAPTVPPPDWDGVCYRAPQKPNANDHEVCNVGQPGPDSWDNFATVVHGIAGSFCASTCQPRESTNCTGCPGACQINDTKTGKCKWCSPHFEGPHDERSSAGRQLQVCCHPQSHSEPMRSDVLALQIVGPSYSDCKVPSCDGSTSNKCSPCDGNDHQHELICPCGVPTDTSGQPILATPQCVLSSCGDFGVWPPLYRHLGMCTLTCDPDLKVPAGRRNCQVGD
jgi:hypothetical protein